MAELPTMPFFTDAYLADTKHLSTLEHGAYFLLLISMWRAGGSLPNDATLLARYAGVPPRNWPRVWEIVGPLFQIEGGRLVQKKLVSTYKKAIEKRNKFRDNGKRGGEAKALKSQEATLANASNPPEVRQPARPTNLNPESLIPNRKIPAPSGTASRKAEKPAPIPRIEPEEMTEAERAKVELFQFGKQCKISGGLINRLYVAYGGDPDMQEACAAARQILERAARARDKGAYIGGVIRRIGTEDAERLNGGWDKGL